MKSLRQLVSCLLFAVLLPPGASAGSDPWHEHHGKSWHAGGLAPGQYRYDIGVPGPSGPLFSGPWQYPFVCWTEASGLGQPLVDNHEGRGVAVFALDASGGKTDTVIGYSEACSTPTRVDYFYRASDGKFYPLARSADRPANLAQTTLPDGRSVDYVVRLERGTLNRFIYAIAMLAPFDSDAARADNSAWNRKLIYSFRGGVGIGHWQGDLRLQDVLLHEGLAQGYAVAASTGNATAVQYNLLLAAETALMVKSRFRALYGKPEYTVGVGSSGGAIQQYIFGEHFPGLIDGAIAIASYSDMITQTIYALDCQLLEHYFDVTARANPRWADWTQRTLIEGLAASNTHANRWTGRPGSSECVEAWRGAEAVALNPHWTEPMYLQALAAYRFPPAVIAGIRWTHWDDLANIYGLDAHGYARRTWDNEGVQYGLRALVNGALSKDEFLHLNANIGGWKPAHEMRAENYPWNPHADPATLDLWDRQSMMLSPDGGVTPAPRTRADLDAIRAAYRGKQVFTGRFDLPVIDMRWYLEPLLDMHHTQQSFATRARLVKARGEAGNQAIWVGVPPHYPLAEALSVMDEWLANLKQRPRRVAEARPARAADRCLDAAGSTLAAGEGVWGGILDDGARGACTQLFPLYTTSRIEAGGSIAGDIFKCRTIPVAAAIARGLYGGAVFTDAERGRLEAIFPGGVCDYTQPGAAHPPRDKRRH